MKHFIKSNPTSDPKALYCEAEGLNLLREHCRDLKIQIPEVYSVSEKELIIELVDTQRALSEQLRILGAELAKLHLKKFERYGLEKDNYIGLNRQLNCWSEDWGSFFADKRLGYQIDIIKSEKVKEEFSVLLRDHRDALIRYLNENCDHPSLVHGDLWSGNFLVSKEAVWLIDPAVYFADREVDLAMTEMFGGFSVAFYEGYDSIYARSPAYSVKKDLYNLYHYLNHYNLFGEGYLSACRQLSARLLQV